MGEIIRRIVSPGRMEPGIVTAVGAWFYSLDTNRYLYLMRNDAKNPGSWGLPGGKIESGETLLGALRRECEEEIGAWPELNKLVPLEQFTSGDGRFAYHTFLCVIDQEFQPHLNHEHLGYAWLDRGQWPRPMHPGLWTTINFGEVRAKIEALVDVIRCRSR